MLPSNRNVFGPLAAAGVALGLDSFADFWDVFDGKSSCASTFEDLCFEFSEGEEEVVEAGVEGGG